MLKHEDKNGSEVKPKTQRQRIYELVKEKGPMAVGEAAEELGLKRANVSAVLASFARDGSIKAIGSEIGLGGSTAFIYAQAEEKSNGRCCSRKSALTPTEARVYAILLEKGPMTIRGLKVEMKVTYGSASGHINRMREKDLVKVAGAGEKGAHLYSTKALPASVPCDCSNLGAVKSKPLPRGKHDKHKNKIVRQATKLGGGPFGLMAAQLGAGA